MLQQEKEANTILKLTFRGGKITKLAGCKVPFYEALIRGQIISESLQTRMWKETARRRGTDERVN